MTKILLVEDDKSLREIYAIRLQEEGYEIVSSGDGEEALAVAMRERPDLIVSDVMMPKISGFDMLDILRSTPETRDVKVIMMTALSSEDQRERGNSLGADRYLVKSQVGIEDVVNTVHEVLGDAPGASQADIQTAAPDTPAPETAPAMPSFDSHTPTAAGPIATEQPTTPEAPTAPITPNITPEPEIAPQPNAPEVPPQPDTPEITPEPAEAPQPAPSAPAEMPSAPEQAPAPATLPPVDLANYTSPTAPQPQPVEAPAPDAAPSAPTPEPQPMEAPASEPTSPPEPAPEVVAPAEAQSATPPMPEPIAPFSTPGVEPANQATSHQPQPSPIEQPASDVAPDTTTPEQTADELDINKMMADALAGSTNETASPVAIGSDPNPTIPEIPPQPAPDATPQTPAEATTDNPVPPAVTPPEQASTPPAPEA